MSKPKKYPSEFREWAVRMLLEQQDQYDSQWAAMNSITVKVGCTAETLRKWVRQVERDIGVRDGTTTRISETTRSGAQIAPNGTTLCARKLSGSGRKLQGLRRP